MSDDDDVVGQCASWATLTKVVFWSSVSCQLIPVECFLFNVKEKAAPSKVTLQGAFGPVVASLVDGVTKASESW